jgi:hypothetical protein
MKSLPTWCFAIEQGKRIGETVWLLKPAVFLSTACCSEVPERNSPHGSLRHPCQLCQISKGGYYTQQAAAQKSPSLRGTPSSRGHDCAHSSCSLYLGNFPPPAGPSVWPTPYYLILALIPKGEGDRYDRTWNRIRPCG